MQAKDFDQKVRDLDERLRAVSASWRAFVHGPDGTSKWTLLNKVLVALSGDDANVIHAYYNESDGTEKLAVVNDSYLLYGEGAMKDMSIKIVPRSDLEGLEVLTAARQTSDWSEDAMTSFVVSFKHGIRITLPLGPGTSGDGEAGIHSLVGQLKNKLTNTALCEE